ncbi:MAG TPA: glutathione S-transferase family protein [Rhizomicrobium sp.]|jgi:glutathione S-transferase|nr:glutathione S-transferase family protein [Rhizomicrobium sp.]
MRKLIHLTLSPASRLARLLVGEKRLTCDPVLSDDPLVHLPSFIDLDGTTATGLWAIVDHLEGTYPEHPLMPEDPVARGEALRWLDWAFGPLHEQVTRRILFEKGAQRFTGAAQRMAPDMNVIRQGREALRGTLKALGEAAEMRGNLATRDCTIADLAVAAHLSALDYFGEVPWTDYPHTAEWYGRIKSRPSFRTLLGDRVPGQPPTASYAELDF